MNVLHVQYTIKVMKHVNVSFSIFKRCNTLQLAAALRRLGGVLRMHLKTDVTLRLTRRYQARNCDLTIKYVTFSLRYFCFKLKFVIHCKQSRY